jgi:hypothetical protein
VGALVGAAVFVGSGAPPQAARMTASRSRVPRSIKIFFIDFAIFSFQWVSCKEVNISVSGHLLAGYFNEPFNLCFILI